LFLMCKIAGTYAQARKKRGPTGKRIQEIRRAQSKSLSNGQDNPILSHDRESELQRSVTTSSINTDFASRSDITGDYAIDSDLANSPSRYGPYWTQTPIGQQSAGGQHSAAIEHRGHVSQSSFSNDQDSLQRVPTSATTFTDNTNPALDPLIVDTPASTDFIFPSLPIDSPSDSWDPFGTILQQELPHVTVDVWPSSVNEATLLPWIDVYFKRLHPTIPILDRTEMYREMLTRKHHTDSHYGAMLLSLCAFAMTQPVQIHERASTPSRAVQARMLMEESVKMRVAADFGENPTMEMILTSFFLFACLFGNGQHKAARHKLREAVDLAYALGIHSPQSHAELDQNIKERWLRTYLVLSVTERAYALQQRHPIEFRGRPGMSYRFMQDFDQNTTTAYVSRLLYADQSDAMALTGLLYLMETFDAIDEKVIECWIGYCRYSDGTCESFDRRRALQMFRAQEHAREGCKSGQMGFAPTVSPLPLSGLLDGQKADIAVWDVTEGQVADD
jgi:hypothetical protein